MYEVHAYKLNKEKRAAEEDGKFLYYFYDRKKLTSVALPEEQFDNHSISFGMQQAKIIR